MTASLLVAFRLLLFFLAGLLLPFLVADAPFGELLADLALLAGVAAFAAAFSLAPQLLRREIPPPGARYRLLGKALFAAACAFWLRLLLPAELDLVAWAALLSAVAIGGSLTTPGRLHLPPLVALLAACLLYSLLAGASDADSGWAGLMNRALIVQSPVHAVALLAMLLALGAAGTKTALFAASAVGAVSYALGGGGEFSTQAALFVAGAALWPGMERRAAAVACAWVVVLVAVLLGFATLAGYLPFRSGQPADFFGFFSVSLIAALVIAHLTIGVVWWRRA